MQFEIGATVKGKVSNITKFGAFVQLEGGQTGLIHISEISKEFVSDIRTVLKENQEIEATVLSVDDKGRIGLSLKKQENKKTKTDFSKSPDDFYSKQTSSSKDFEDMIHKFKVLSDDKLCDINKGVQSKRGTSYKKRR